MNVRDVKLTPEDLRFVPPAFSDEEILDVLEDQYGLTGVLEPLAGERDQNHRLITPDGKQLVAKVSSLYEEAAVIDFQTRALLHLEKKDPELAVPRLMRTRGGQVTTSIRDPAGRQHPVRLFGYLPGIPFDMYSPSLGGLEKIGAFQGRLSRALGDFHHPVAHHFMPWDISNGLVFNEGLFEDAGADIQAIVSRFLPHLESVTFPALSALRRQVIHNDCHSGNLLRAGEQSDALVGVIDFGDMIEAPLVQDVAVSMASFIRTEPRQLEAIASIAKGFHSVYPLEDKEFAAIYDMVILRLVLALLLIDYRLRIIDNPPAELVEEIQLILKALSRFGDLERDAVAAYLRQTCDSAPGKASAQ